MEEIKEIKFGDLEGILKRARDYCEKPENKNHPLVIYKMVLTLERKETAGINLQLFKSFSKKESPYFKIVSVESKTLQKTEERVPVSSLDSLFEEKNNVYSLCINYEHGNNSFPDSDEIKKIANKYKCLITVGGLYCRYKGGSFIITNSKYILISNRHPYIKDVDASKEIENIIFSQETPAEEKILAIAKSEKSPETKKEIQIGDFLKVIGEKSTPKKDLITTKKNPYV